MNSVFILMITAILPQKKSIWKMNKKYAALSLAIIPILLMIFYGE